jgi:hypothetical protein
VNTGSNSKQEDRELKIEGFIASQNVQTTKNSSTKKPLKIRKLGGRGEINEQVDPCSTLQNNLISKQNYFRRGERNIPKYRLLSKPLSSGLSDQGDK